MLGGHGARRHDDRGPQKERLDRLAPDDPLRPEVEADLGMRQELPQIGREGLTGTWRVFSVSETTQPSWATSATASGPSTRRR